MSDAAPPRTEPSLIDEARVAILRRDLAAWSEIVALYREYTAGLLDSFERELAQGTWTGVLRHLHQLKGCSANLGLLAVTAVCEDLEASSPAAVASHQPGTTARLRELVARSVSALG